MTSHDEAVRREFAKQAATFEDPAYSIADRRLIAWIQRNVPAEPGTAVMDVAGGTGHMARGYADTAAVAVVLEALEKDIRNWVTAWNIHLLALRRASRDQSS